MTCMRGCLACCSFDRITRLSPIEVSPFCPSGISFQSHTVRSHSKGQEFSFGPFKFCKCAQGLRSVQGTHPVCQSCSGHLVWRRESHSQVQASLLTLTPKRGRHAADHFVRSRAHVHSEAKPSNTSTLCMAFSIIHQ